MSWPWCGAHEKSGRTGARRLPVPAAGRARVIMADRARLAHQAKGLRHAGSGGMARHAHAPPRGPRWLLLAALLVLHLLALVMLAAWLAPQLGVSVTQAPRALTIFEVSDPRGAKGRGAAADASTAAGHRLAGSAAEGDPGAGPPAAGASGEQAAAPISDPAFAAPAAAGGQAEGGEQGADGSGAAGPGPGAAADFAGLGTAGPESAGPESAGPESAGPGWGSGQQGAARGPSVRSGRIDSARDFPAPPGGRQQRAGTRVTIAFTVGVDGRARDCIIAEPGPDPATNARVCALVIERIRFNPARNAQGEAVSARYGWRQEFFGS